VGRGGITWFIVQRVINLSVCSQCGKNKGKYDAERHKKRNTELYRGCTELHREKREIKNSVSSEKAQ